MLTERLNEIIGPSPRVAARRRVEPTGVTLKNGKSGMRSYCGLLAAIFSLEEIRGPIWAERKGKSFKLRGTTTVQKRHKETSSSFCLRFRNTISKQNLTLRRSCRPGRLVDAHVDPGHPSQAYPSRKWCDERCTFIAERVCD